MTEGAQSYARPLEGPVGFRETDASPLSASQQDYIRRIASVHAHRRGELIFGEGDAGQFVFFVESGVIRISRCAENGHRQILAFRVPGDLFGVPEAGSYLNSAEAASEARIYRLSWQRMQQFMREEPQLLSDLLTKILHNFRQAQSRLMTLGQQNTYQRLASVLLDFSRVPEFFDREQSFLNLPISRFDVADYLAAPRQSTTRAFAKLESQGLIRRISSRTIEILDVEGLELMQSGPRRNDSPDQSRWRPRLDSNQRPTD